VITTLGGELTDPFEVDGEERQAYVLEIPGVVLEVPSQYDGKVPFFWAESEAPFNPHVLPSITVRRNEPAPNMDGKSWWGASVVPAEGAATVEFEDDEGNTVSGPDRVEVQERAEFVRLGYELIIAAALETEMQYILREVMRVCRYPGFPVYILDSNGDERGYDATDVSFSRMTELMDVGERMSAHSVTFDIHAELDVVPPTEHDTLTAPVEVTYNGI
tara:strand:+ start:3730 stop:4383 length:654 start_codon:yes stop_codon:yes gene_type:complete